MRSPLLILLAFILTDVPKADSPSSDQPKENQGASEKKATTTEAPAPKRVLDRSYQPAVGDRAVLFNPDEKGESYLIWASKTPEGFQEYLKAERMENEKRTDELEKAEKALVLDEDTPVLVMNITPVQFPVSGPEAVNFGNGVAVGARMISEVAVTVRILDGPHKGTVVYTPLENISRFRTGSDTPQAGRGSTRKTKAKKLKPKAKAAETVAPKLAKPVDPAAKAASLFKLGQNLEKAGKTAGALDFYRNVLAQFPNSPEAKKAAQRIDALGKSAQK